MKFLVILVGLLFSLNTFSKCNFYLEKDSILWTGLTLNYGRGLTDIMVEKGYSRVYREDLSDFEIKVVINEVDGRFFKHAIANFEIKDETFSRDSRCLTQSCGISDLGKVTNKVLRDIRKRLDACL